MLLYTLSVAAMQESTTKLTGQSAKVPAQWDACIQVACFQSKGFQRPIVGTAATVADDVCC